MNLPLHISGPGGTKVVKPGGSSLSPPSPLKILVC